jgi:hypothetical protein
VFQESADLEDGVRPVLARGSIERQSTLARNGRSAPGCDGAPPAEGCGTASFDAWKLFFVGRGRRIAGGLRSGTVAGGDPLPRCTHDQLFPDTFRHRSIWVPQGSPFRRKRMTLSDKQSKTKRFNYAYENTTGTVTRTIEWKAKLVRKGPVTRGGQPIR